MSNKLNAGPHALREALYELSMAQEVPDARLLDEIVRRYPDLGGVLTESAIVLALDALRGRTDEAGSVGDPRTVSPTVRDTMKRFQTRLSTLPKAGLQGRGRKQGGIRTADSPNPFEALDRKDFRALAERLNTNSVFVCKLRDRQIDPDTIPPAFQRRVAEELDVPLELLQAHFAGRQLIHAGQRFKAEGRPVLGARQSFEEAVRNSDLTADQQRALLDI
jgi:hypothetical protein